MNSKKNLEQKISDFLKSFNPKSNKVYVHMRKKITKINVFSNNIS